MATSKAPTKAEAIRLARGNATLGRVLEGGGDIVLVEPERGRGKGDRVVVGVHDRQGARSLVALVDRDGVVGVHETPARFQLSEQERTVAEKLAAADGRAKSFLRRRRMNPLTRLYFPPGDTSGHRHAIVFLRPTSSERRYVVVDLTDARVVDVLDEADLTRGAGG
jgi:hypothetical protein